MYVLYLAKWPVDVILCFLKINATCWCHLAISNSARIHVVVLSPVSPPKGSGDSGALITPRARMRSKG